MYCPQHALGAGRSDFTPTGVGCATRPVIMFGFVVVVATYRWARILLHAKAWKTLVS